MSDSPPRLPPHHRLLWLLGNLLLLWLPLAAVDIPPLADLPQHMAQVREWQELLGWMPATRDLTLLEANPLQPNALVYLPALLAAQLTDAVTAGKLLVALLLGLHALALHALALRLQRAPQLAVLASVLAFNCAFYWCFANYLLAMPLALLAVATLAVPGWSLRRELAVLAVLGLLLAWSHVLVLGMTGLLLGLMTLVRWPGWRRALLRGAALAPALVYALGFAAALADQRAKAGFSLEPAWFSGPAERLTLDWASRAFFGGLGGDTEDWLTAALLLWLVVGGVQALRRRQASAADRAGEPSDQALVPVLAAGALLVVWAWLAPDKYLNTIVFSRRFAPYGLMLLLLAVPPPQLPASQQRLQPLLAGLLPVATAVVFALSTALGWLGWQATEASGLRPALAAIGKPARVLGLDFVYQTEALRLRVLLQQFAWAEALYGGEGNFSFAEHGSSVVRFVQPRPGSWTRGLEWNAGKVAPTDFAAFDYALVAGDAEVHARFGGFSGGTALTTQGVWRAWRLPAAQLKPDSAD